MHITATRTAIALLGVCLIPLLAHAGSGIITTVAGDGTRAYRGDGGAATSAWLNFPSGVALDASGNLYIADQSNNRVRKVDVTTGIITTVAGNGTQTYSGDDGAATDASLYFPSGIALDATGNLYIADTNHHRIRKVDGTTGIITTVAGNGNSGYNGDNAAATSKSLNYPSAVFLDSSNNLYIADLLNHRIRKVDASTGFITTVAGSSTSGFSGDNGLAIYARLDRPDDIALDASGSHLYIADRSNHRIRKVDLDNGIITTVAGDGTNAYNGYNGDNIAATSANLSYPNSVFVDTYNHLYIADSNIDRIRKVDALTAMITTVAGDGTQGSTGDGGAATDATLNSPYGVALDASGNLYIADSSNHRIRRVDAAGGPRVFVDTTSGTASTDGTIDAGEYQHFSGGINDSFGTIGELSKLHIDSSDSGDVHFGLETPGNLNRVVVIYIDSVPGGFANTASFNDVGNALRSAASGLGISSGQSMLTFADGFAADYAITMSVNWAVVLELTTTSHVQVDNAQLNPTGNTTAGAYEFDFPLSAIGIAPGDFFRYVATHIHHNTADRSNEFHGVASTTVTNPTSLGANPVTLSAGDYNTFFTSGCSRTLNLTQGRWHLVGPPCNLGVGGTVESVFVTNGNLVFGDYSGTWVVYKHDAGTNSYVQLALTDRLEIGGGYWVKTTEADKFGSFSGSKNLAPTTIALTANAADPAAGRLNMISHPYNLKVDWADVRVIDPSQTPSVLTLDQADPDTDSNSVTDCAEVPVHAGCVMSRVMYQWNGSNHDSFDGGTPSMQGDLQALDGLWVKTFKTGISLQVTFDPTKVAQAPAKSTSLTDNKAIETSGGAWQVRLIAQATTAGGQLLRDAGNLLGQLSDSLDGRDHRDLPELSPFGNDYLTIVFAQHEWGDHNGGYASDHRRITGPGDGKWDFEVHTSLPVGTQVTLSWEGPDAALKKAVLYDYTTNGDAKTGVDGSYTFTVTSPVHTFAWDQQAWRKWRGQSKLSTR